MTQVDFGGKWGESIFFRFSFPNSFVPPRWPHIRIKPKFYSSLPRRRQAGSDPADRLVLVILAMTKIGRTPQREP